MLQNSAYWKLWLTGLVAVFITFIITLDFTDPIHPAWNTFNPDELPSTTEMNGAKAAILAMAGAATLFIGFIPSRGNNSRRIDVLVRIVGAAAVGATGWFWLLSATGGNFRPYLFAVVPTLLLVTIILTFNIVLGRALEMDERQIKNTGKAKLTWNTAILAIVMLLAFASVISAMVFLPQWLF